MNNYNCIYIRNVARCDVIKKSRHRSKFLYWQFLEIPNWENRNTRFLTCWYWPGSQRKFAFTEFIRSIVTSYNIVNGYIIIYEIDLYDSICEMLRIFTLHWLCVDNLDCSKSTIFSTVWNAVGFLISWNHIYFMGALGPRQGKWASLGMLCNNTDWKVCHFCWDTMYNTYDWLTACVEVTIYII